MGVSVVSTFLRDGEGPVEIEWSSVNGGSRGLMLLEEYDRRGDVPHPRARGREDVAVNLPEMQVSLGLGLCSY